MRTLFVGCWLSNLLLSLAGWGVLPARVPVHFGPGGRADAWGNSAGQALLMSAVVTLLFAVFWFVPRAIPRMPPHLVNLPHKQYWLAPERRAECAERLGRYLHAFGAALLLFFFLTQLLVIRAYLVEPPRLDERIFMPALAGVLVFAISWCAALYRGFRPPACAARPR